MAVVYKLHIRILIYGIQSSFFLMLLLGVIKNV